jgi:hypothetical protein
LVCRGLRGLEHVLRAVKRHTVFDDIVHRQLVRGVALAAESGQTRTAATGARLKRSQDLVIDSHGLILGVLSTRCKTREHPRHAWGADSRNGNFSPQRVGVC